MKALKFTGEKQTDNIETVSELNDTLKEWLETIDMPFDDVSELSIENFEFRSRDGFSAHSHNKGGLDLITVTTIDRLVGSGEQSGLEIEKWVDTQYDETYKQVVEDNPTLDSQSDEFYNELDASFCNDYDAVAYRIRAMYEGDGVLRIYSGYDKDAPYFRFKGAVSFEVEIKFKTISGLKRQLKAVKNKLEKAQ